MIDLLVKEQGAGTRIWIAAGVTDMRRGFQGLAAQVQTALEQQPYSGHIFIFRGRQIARPSPAASDPVPRMQLGWGSAAALCLSTRKLTESRALDPGPCDMGAMVSYTKVSRR